MRGIMVLAGFLLLITAVSNGFALEPDYRLGPRDHLKFDIWTWGNEPVSSQEATIRPDGKITLAVSLSKSENYRLGPGDTLSISVWDCEELSNPQLVVRPDGRIGVALLGEIDVSGMTPLELNRKLTAELSRYVNNPRVTVNVIKFRSVPLVEEFEADGLTLEQLTAKVNAAFRQYCKEAKVVINITQFRTTRVYVLGEVHKPGICEMEREHNLLDAIGAAGGFTKAADKKKVYLVRHGETRQYTLINLDSLLKKGDISLNCVLNEGDVVFLARRKADYINDILPFITALYEVHNL